MKRLVAAILVALAGLVGMAATASAEGQLCHSVTVQVNGEVVVNDAACTALP